MKLNHLHYYTHYIVLGTMERLIFFDHGGRRVAEWYLVMNRDGSYDFNCLVNTLKDRGWETIYSEWRGNIIDKLLNSAIVELYETDNSTNAESDAGGSGRQVQADPCSSVC